MLKIRLQRIGRKNDPSFRIVVTDSRKGPKSGKYVELLGSYNPRQNSLNIKGERVSHWILNGAQVSGTVHNILIKEGIIQGEKMNVLPKKTPVVKEDGKEDAAEITEEKQEETEAVVVKESKVEASTEEPKEKEEVVEKKPASTDTSQDVEEIPDSADLKEEEKK